MNVEVRYHSKTGNTQKIAAVIASEAGVRAKPITEPPEDKVDILYLGGAVYGFDIDPELKDYIKSLDPKQIGTVVVFSTSSLVKSVSEKIKKVLEEQGLHVAQESFHCPGHYKLLKKGRPNEADLKQAKQFAASTLKQHSNNK